MEKRIVLCADDYGQEIAISQGILALLKQRRLSAVSCMVNTHYWLTHADGLKEFKAQADIGLHFNLTEGRPLSPQYIAAYGENFFPLSTLMHKAFYRRLNDTAILAEGLAQVERFHAAMGFFPRFIDGHQHIQQFPVIRQAITRIVRNHLRQENTYIRWVNAQIAWKDGWQNPKKVIIRLFGTRALKKLLLAEGIPHNTTFSGIYPFSQAQHYADLFPSFLREIHDGGLIMCHPALKPAPNTKDPIASARYAEYQYFSSDSFLNACKQQGVLIEKFI